MTESDDHDVRSLAAKAPATGGGGGEQAAGGRRKYSPAPRGGQVLQMAAHCPLHEGEDVARLKRAASAVGLKLTSLPRLAPTAGALPVGSRLMIVHLDEDAAALQRHLAAEPDKSLARMMVVVADDRDEALIDKLLAAGIAGFIPRRFDEQAMRGALEMLLAGEHFVPYHPNPSGTHGRHGSLLGSNGHSVMDDFGLTKVEREVLILAAQGLTNHDIAQRRGGTEGTVKVHMNHIFTKLGVRGRCEAIGVYLQLHDVDTDALRDAQNGHMDMKWLLASMTHEHHRKDTMLFRCGDPGTKFYYLQHGHILLEEIDVTMGPKEVFGEIGLFAPHQQRTCSARCTSDVDVFTLSFEEVERCLLLNPKFTFFIMRLITERLMADRERFRNALARQR